jgi:hypothetical protein
MYFEFPAKFSLIHLVPELDSSKDWSCLNKVAISVAWYKSIYRKFFFGITAISSDMAYFFFRR